MREAIYGWDVEFVWNYVVMTETLYENYVQQSLTGGYSKRREWLVLKSFCCIVPWYWDYKWVQNGVD